MFLVWHFCFSSKNKKLKGAKKEKEKILLGEKTLFFWAILMFLRPALRVVRAPDGA